ncbi:MAG: hypothetical protein LBH06_09940 [Rikenellaceae bacterium]|jgi:hypothetical protein|nr:hypothetical protein [Rikenellaceae bacterium]
MKTFVYREKFTFGCCWPAISFAILAVLSQIFHYGVGFRTLQFLDYPNSVYVFSACALVSIAYAANKWGRARVSAKNPNPIEVDQTGLAFPQGGADKLRVAFADVKQLRHKKDEDDGRQLIIYTVNNDRYTFREDRFASASEFAAFETIMNENCTNITNR